MFSSSMMTRRCGTRWNSFSVCRVSRWHVYSSGAELLADQQLGRAGCVIIDDSMPCMDGLQLIEQLREREISVPAILITSHATDRLHARAAIAGVKVVLEKPFLEQALTASIQTILDGRNERCA